MGLQDFKIGGVVWAPLSWYGGSEIRVVVIEIEDGGWMWVKLPGSDAGTTRVQTSKCVTSYGPAMNVMEAQARQREDEEKAAGR